MISLNTLQTEATPLQGGSSITKTQTPTSRSSGSPTEIKQLHERLGRSPPDISEAHYYGLTRKVYKNGSTSYTREDRIPLCCNLSDLLHLGISFPLYFNILKLCLYLLTSLLVISGLFGLVTNIAADYCSEEGNPICTTNFIIVTTIANKANERKKLVIQEYLSLASFIIMLVFLQIIKAQQRRMAYFYDVNISNPSDYAVLVRNLPRSATNYEIKEFFEKEVVRGTDCKVVDICECYQISSLVTAYRKREILLAKSAPRKTSNSSSRQDAKLKILNQSISDMEETIMSQRNGRAIITFQSQKDRRLAVQNSRIQSSCKRYIYNLTKNTSLLPIKFKGHGIRIEQAPEPNDILWENFGQSGFKRKVMTGSLSLLLVGFAFALVILLNYVKGLIKNHIDNANFDVPVSQLIAFVILMVNIRLGGLMKGLISHEKYSTYSKYFSSVGRKLAIVLFMNSMVTIWLANVFHSPSSREVTEARYYFGRSGILKDYFFFFLSNFYIPTLWGIFEPGWLYRIWRRKKLIKEGFASKCTQREANAIFDGPQLDLAVKYSNLMKDILLFMFFHSILPISSICIIARLIAVYWTDKYSLLRRCAAPKIKTGKKLSKDMLLFLQWMPFLFAAGNMLGLVIVSDFEDNFHAHVIGWVILALAVFNRVFPLVRLNKLFFRISKDKSEGSKQYKEAKSLFETEYYIENPISRARYLQDKKNGVSGSSALLSDGGASKTRKPSRWDVVRKRMFTKVLSGYATDHITLENCANDRKFSRKIQVTQALNSQTKELFNQFLKGVIFRTETDLADRDPISALLNVFKPSTLPTDQSQEESSAKNPTAIVKPHELGSAVEPSPFAKIFKSESLDARPFTNFFKLKDNKEDEGNALLHQKDIKQLDSEQTYVVAEMSEPEREPQAELELQEITPTVYNKVSFAANFNLHNADENKQSVLIPDGEDRYSFAVNMNPHTTQENRLGEEKISKLHRETEFKKKTRRTNNFTSFI